MEVETLTDVVESTKQFKIRGFSLTSAMASDESIRSRKWNVGGYDWEARVLPMHFTSTTDDCVSLDLHLCTDPPKNSNLKAKVCCHLIDQWGSQPPYQCSTVQGILKHSGEVLYEAFVVKREKIKSWGYVKDDSVIIECTLTVVTNLMDMSITGHSRNDVVLSSGGLPSDLGELLQKGTGADVTFLVSGESFTAHKAILASRSPVFMAEFFGHMKEECSQQVEIKDMEPSVFGAMLCFIYTDSVPAFLQEDGMAIAQHLLVAADRYGIDKLKSICEDKLYDGIDVETAASTLALAEQHTCSRLKSKCLELISADLEAVMATEGYKNILMTSCPPVLMNDLLKAVHGRRN